MRRFITVAAALALALALGIPDHPAQAGLGDCLPMMCKFSEAGKNGPFIKAEVAPDDLAKADATLASAPVGGTLYAAESVNRGEFRGAGLKMPETEAALGALVTKLRAQWPYRQPPPVRIRILGSTTFSPLAHPDDVIVVPIGVIYRAQDDDEVAWLMAHEFSHLALAHFARAVRAQRRQQTVSAVFDTVQTGLDAAQHRVDNSGGRARVYAVDDPEVARLSDAVWVNNMRAKVFMSLANAFYSRQQEDQADVAGMDLALATGYSDGGAGEALDELAKDDDTFTNIIKAMMTDIGALAQKSAANGGGQVLQGGNPGTIGQDILHTMTRNVGAIIVDKFVTRYQSSHRPTPKRKIGINTYYANAYKMQPPVDPATAWLTAVRATQEYKEGIAAVLAQNSALDLLAKGQPQQAQAALQPALTTRYARTPLISNAAARIADALGDQHRADQLYSIAERLPGFAAAPPTVAPVSAASAEPKRHGARRRSAAPPAPIAAVAPIVADPFLDQNLDGFADHVALLVTMHDYPKALAVIAEAKRRFGDDMKFLPAYIAIYTQTNQTEKLVATLSRCADTGDDATRASCQTAMLSDDQQKKVAALPPADQDRVYAELDRTSAKAQRTDFWSRIGQSIKPDADKDDSTN